MSTFTTKDESHRVCGQKQQTDHDASVMCSKFLTAAKPNRTLLCTRESLTRSASSDLVALCEPTVREPVGVWLEDMIETFGMRYTEWTKENHERQNNVVANLTACSRSRFLGQLDWRVGAPRTIIGLHTPTQFLKQTHQLCVGSVVGWPLPGWRVWRMP